MKTTSGAHVNVVGSYAVKYGRGDVGRRVRDQADYVRHLGEAVCPTVVRTFPNGYVMERLDPHPLKEATPGFVRSIIDVLQDHVWHRPPQYVLGGDWRLHREYVQGRAREWAPWAARPIENLYVIAAPWLSPPCLTHGDPTIENCMVDVGCEINFPWSYPTPYLIDPLPPKMLIPQVKEVDLGKVMQSLYGYEAVKAGFIPRPHPEWLPEEFVTPAVYYWTAVHFVRLLPYQTEHAVRKECEVLLMEVLKDACDL